MAAKICRCFKGPKYADASRVQNRSFTSRETIHLRFALTPKSSQAAGAARRGSRPRSTVPKGGGRKAPRPPPGPGPATTACPHIGPAAPTSNGPIAGRSQQRHRRRGQGLVFRTLRRPVWRLVRGSEGAGQGATHGRGRFESSARPPPDRSHYSQSSLAIWTALVAAPLRIWSPQHQKVIPRAASGFEISRRTRPTQIRS